MWYSYDRITKYTSQEAAHMLPGTQTMKVSGLECGDRCASNMWPLSSCVLPLMGCVLSPVMKCVLCPASNGCVLCPVMKCVLCPASNGCVLCPVMKCVLCPVFYLQIQGEEEEEEEEEGGGGGGRGRGGRFPA